MSRRLVQLFITASLEIQCIINKTDGINSFDLDLYSTFYVTELFIFNYAKVLVKKLDLTKIQANCTADFIL